MLLIGKYQCVIQSNHRIIISYGFIIVPMNHEEIREYCMAKPGVTEGFPFNYTARVFMVAGKMFALFDLTENSRGISLKCDPELAIDLGKHM